MTDRSSLRGKGRERPVKLSQATWDALKHAAKPEGLRWIIDADPPAERPVHPNTWNALLRRGLCEERLIRNRHGLRVRQLVATAEGRLVLDPPMRRVMETPRSLRAKGAAVTRVMRGGVWLEQCFPEPEEETDPATLQPGWRQRATERHEEAMTPRQIAAALVSELRRAA